ncbi:unnamed protein product [Toxocara canis]|uniref:DM domain-containing protein n=1 Tax=Toxocara canis TaxID=6265 RepID=A0A183UP60_TOXCA|nr:unnamed protein product [Toxocara canis]
MMRFDNFNTLAALNVAAANAAAADKIGNKRVYYCQRCLNHNRLEPRKNHKCECIYATCTCNKCILVEKRRVLNTQLHELEEIVDGGIQADIDEQFNPGGTRIKGANDNVLNNLSKEQIDCHEQRNSLNSSINGMENRLF